MRIAAGSSGKGWLYKDLAAQRWHKLPAWYITHIDLRNISTIARLRTRNHQLMVEKGDWSDIAWADRNCLMCKTLEDEAHVIYD